MEAVIRRSEQGECPVSENTQCEGLETGFSVGLERQPANGKSHDDVTNGPRTGHDNCDNLRKFYNGSLTRKTKACGMKMPFQYLLHHPHGGPTAMCVGSLRSALYKKENAPYLRSGTPLARSELYEAASKLFHRIKTTLNCKTNQPWPYDREQNY